MEGAFAFIIMTKDCMYAVRDKNGLRPLSLAFLEDGYCISSETCAFDIVGAKFIRDIEPGEVVRIASDGVKSFHYTDQVQHKMCAMEYIYFARPDSSIEGINVHTSRRHAGCFWPRAMTSKRISSSVCRIPASRPRSATAKPAVFRMKSV